MSLFRRFTRKKTSGDVKPVNASSPAANASLKPVNAYAASAAATSAPKPQANGPVNVIPEEEAGSQSQTTREDVEKLFSDFAQVIHASLRPLPTQTGDGSYIEKVETTSLWKDLSSMGLKDARTVRHLIEDKVRGQHIDDRQMHMEELMQLVAALPTKSKTRVELTSMFLDQLWKSLEHPPQSYLGDDFKYRSADGSNNNYCFPKLGAANTPYARSVQPMTIQPGALPDAGLIFDSVMARDSFIPHPNKVSSIFFNWASLVIHDIFQTNHEDFSISQTSSYLDLSILYGDTQKDQDLMRTFKDGKIKPDCFSEERLLAFPPACGTILIMLNRWHNYVVEQLAMINEGGRFTKPRDHLQGEKKKKAWEKYDNDLFQTGRLITCGLYINITLHDYLRTIVNLNRTNSTWVLDPRLDTPVPKHYVNEGTPRGTGNQVSAEFALSYRWHSCIGLKDEEWTKMIYYRISGGKDPDDVTLPQLLCMLAEYENAIPADPLEREFAGLKRGPDGNFNDNDLANILVEGIEEIAGAFGARNIPKCMKAITMLGIEQGRAWHLGSLNEFRKFFDLKPYDTFEEINPDPYVAEQLKHLYEHPDYVELYPGIATEATKSADWVPGVGICPTYTISRAVLSDAVALVRGDRHYTVS